MNYRDEIPRSEVNSLVQSLEDHGFAVINDYVSQTELSELHSFAQDQINANGGQYVDIRTLEGIRGTSVADIAKSSKFVNLCKKLSDAGLGRNSDAFDLYHVVRLVKGSTGRKVAGVFHYDSFTLTIVLPIVVPKDGSGGLLILGNTRRIRKWYIFNLLDKMIVLNRFTQKWLYWRSRRKGRLMRLALKPGNLYVFWGYRTLHAQEPTDPNDLRATAIFHYGDPHTNSRLRNFIRNRRDLNKYGTYNGNWNGVTRS